MAVAMSATDRLRNKPTISRRPAAGAAPISDRRSCRAGVSSWHLLLAARRTGGPFRHARFCARGGGKRRIRTRYAEKKGSLGPVAATVGQCRAACKTFEAVNDLVDSRRERWVQWSADLFLSVDKCVHPQHCKMMFEGGPVGIAVQAGSRWQTLACRRVTCAVDNRKCAAPAALLLVLIPVPHHKRGSLTPQASAAPINQSKLVYVICSRSGEDGACPYGYCA